MLNIKQFGLKLNFITQVLNYWLIVILIEVLSCFEQIVKSTPLLTLSSRNEMVLKAQLENNQYLKVLLNGVFYLNR